MDLNSYPLIGLASALSVIIAQNQSPYNLQDNEFSVYRAVIMTE